MSQLDKPSVISKLYNNRRTIVDTSNNVKPTIQPTIQPILPSSPAKTYKHTETNSISTDVIDGVKHTVYKQFQSITHIYNNRGVVSTTTHNNTFTYVV